MATILVNPGQSIQAAIDSAADGDTIQIAAGTYNESLVINKQIRLQGDRKSTILTAGANNNAVTLAAGSSGSTIRNFSIQGSRAGIGTAPGEPIRNVNITRMRFFNLERHAILVGYGASNFQITENSISQVNVGVQILAQDARRISDIKVENNRIRDVSGIALYLNTLSDDPASTSGITFRNNQITQDIQEIGNNLSLITLQFPRLASHGPVRVLNNDLTFRGSNQQANAGLYGVRVTGNISRIAAINNTIKNEVRGEPFLSGGIWVEAQAANPDGAPDDTYGKIPGTARLKLSRNVFDKLNAPIFYDGVVAADTRFKIRGNVYRPFAGSELGDIFGGTSASETANGQSGNDILFGADRLDQLLGRGGNDSLVGSRKDDVLIGGTGRDQLIGAGGKDVVTGGADNDLFVLDRLEKKNITTITDFEPGADTIELVNIISPSGLRKRSEFSDFVQFERRSRTTQVLVDSDGAEGGRNFQQLAELQRISVDQVRASNFVFNVRGTDDKDVLIGSTQNDFFTGGLSNDTLTGGGGLNQFIFLKNDFGRGNVDVITDFNPKADLLNFRDILKGVEYQSSNPFKDYIRLVKRGANTEVFVTPEGDIGPKSFQALAVLQGVAPGELTRASFSFY